MESIDIEEVDCDNSFKIKKYLPMRLDDRVTQYDPYLSHKDFYIYGVILTITLSKNNEGISKTPFTTVSMMKKNV